MSQLTIDQLTGQIIDRLMAALPDFVIEKMPIDPEIIGSPVVENQIWVALDSISSDAPPGGMVGRRTYHQPEIWRFALTLRVFDLAYGGEHLGLITAVRGAISGLGSGSADSSAGLYHSNTAPVQFAEGLWLYQSIYQINSHYTTILEANHYG
jgi:hypothetical protein